MSAHNPMKQAGHSIKDCLISIKDKQNNHCGHGFLIDDKHVATCAHVIAVALGDKKIKRQPKIPTEKIKVTFCFSRDEVHPVDTNIEVWAPCPKDEDPENPCDIAILRLEKKCPRDSKSPEFISTDHPNGDKFFILGRLRETVDNDVIHGSFTGGGHKYSHQIQQDNNIPGTVEIDEGFSGAPVWDVNLEGVVGMLCKVDTNDSKIGYAVPIIAIKEIYNDLFTVEPEPPRIREYREGFSSKINDGNLPCPVPDDILELSFTLAEDNIFYKAQEIFDIMRQKYDDFVILTGAAGGGKSFVTGRIIRDLAGSGSNVIPVFVILGGWDTQDSDELEKIYKSDSGDDGRHDRLADIVFRKSLVSVSAELLREFSISHEILIVLDGLNEVAKGDIRDKILSSFEGYLQNTLKEPNKNYIMITDRRQHRHRSGMAQQYELKRLSECEIKRKIGKFVDKGTFENISPQCMQLLNLPYFLDLAICNQSVDFDSYSQAIYLFLINKVRLTDENIEDISEAAFSAYKNTFQSSGGLSFPKRIFEEKLSTNLISKLYKDRIIEDVNSERLKFDHQLKHDYFGARHLAHNSIFWERKSFDAISQDSGSAQALSMALEQLAAESKDGDKLIERIYDWNWAIAVECLIEAYRMKKKCCSHAIEFAIVAMVAEKKFDPVEHSSERSRRALDEFKEDWIKPFREAKDRPALSKIVAEHALGTDEWYVKWKNLFTLENRDESHLEEVFSFLTDEHSLVGWCSANVLRRFPVVNENIQRELRKLYSEYTKDNPHHDAVRWRIVHVLGSLSSSENVKLLLKAVSNDKYLWVRYGSARSLIEAAATAPNGELKKFVINMLTERIPDLDRIVCQEIGKTVFYRHCGDNWIEESKILLEKILETSKIYEDKNLWNKKIECFEKGHWKKNKEKI